MDKMWTKEDIMLILLVLYQKKKKKKISRGLNKKPNPRSLDQKKMWKLKPHWWDARVIIVKLQIYP